ncbi:MAG: 50S ribosomal protein L23 [Candidatus Wolfebacteria bacterium]|nr:50S ribosomal protein L23 [Candidatus Wolfebacteria bacterium]
MATGIKVKNSKTGTITSASPKPEFLVKKSWISEKAGRIMADRQYVFIVDRRANKSEVKKAIQSLYKVKVSGVNIIEVKGKTKRLGRSVGRTPDYKKAIVTLREGEKIEALAV